MELIHTHYTVLVTKQVDLIHGSDKYKPLVGRYKKQFQGEIIKDKIVYPLISYVVFISSPEPECYHYSPFVKKHENDRAYGDCITRVKLSFTKVGNIFICFICLRNIIS